MRVLVACEESQRVCIAFRNKGHFAFSCDLQDCSGGFPQYHIKGNVLDYINGHCEFITCDGVVHNLASRWDMIVAFPPCTYFSRMNFLNYYRKGKFNQARFDKALEYVDLFNSIYNANCSKICIENPVPFKLFDDLLPKYTMTLQPYEYGETYSKKTCLWLKGLPPLLPTCIKKCNGPMITTSNSFLEYKDIFLQSKMRSKTPIGLALAMAEQWC